MPTKQALVILSFCAAVLFFLLAALTVTAAAAGLLIGSLP